MKKIWIVNPQYGDDKTIHSEEELNTWCRNIFTGNKHEWMGKIEITELEISCETKIEFNAYVDSMIRDIKIEKVFEADPETQYRADVEDLFGMVAKAGHDTEKLDFLRKCMSLNGWKESTCREILGRYKRYFVKTIPEKMKVSERDEYFEKLARIKNFETTKYKVELNTIKIK